MVPASVGTITLSPIAPTMNNLETRSFCIIGKLVSARTVDFTKFKYLKGYGGYGVDSGCDVTALTLAGDNAGVIVGGAVSGPL